MADALAKFAEQSGIQVMFYTDATDGLLARPISGAFDPKDALKDLLAGTPLRAEFVNAHTVAIIGPPTGSQAVDRRVQAEDSSPAPVRDDSAAQGPRAEHDASVKEVPGDASEKSNRNMQVVVVTGTQIRGVTSGSSPLTIYRRQDIDQMGVSTLTDFMQKVPSNFSSVSPLTTNSSVPVSQTGTNTFSDSTFNLHGLGAGSTLVLLNGQRLAPSGGAGQIVDISMIPLSAVDRVEILADGASALYGADAIGGVVNVILRRDVTGADSGLRYSAATDGGSSQYMASQVVGHSWSTGNAMLTYEYSDDHGLDSRERNYVPDLGGTLLLLPQQIRQNLVKERLFGQRRW